MLVALRISPEALFWCCICHLRFLFYFFFLMQPGPGSWFLLPTSWVSSDSSGLSWPLYSDHRLQLAFFFFFCTLVLFPWACLTMKLIMRKWCERGVGAHLAEAVFFWSMEYSCFGYLFLVSLGGSGSSSLLVLQEGWNRWIQKISTSYSLALS